MTKDAWVIFDGDNTLWQVEHIYNEAREKLCSYISSKSAATEIEIESFQQSRDVELFANLGYSCLRFPTSFEQTAIHFLGIQARKEISHVQAIAHQVFTRQPDYSTELDHLIPALKVKYKLALITAGEEWVQKSKLANFKLIDQFDEISIVERKTVDVLKDFVARNNIDASTSWVVGDSLLSDVEPALRCGLNVIWLNKENWDRIENRKTMEDIEGYKKINRVFSLNEVLTLVLEK